MSKEFRNMKASGDQMFDRLLNHIRPDIGRQKKTKLKRALGPRAASTLLDDEVWKTHAARLEKQFVRRWGTISKKAAHDRLRFWTVLDSLVLVNEDAILTAVAAMFDRLERVCQRVRGIEVIGACEIEIVNVGKMCRHAEGVDEARKLHVIETMMPQGKGSLETSSLALIHFHGLVDFGQDAETKSNGLGRVARSVWDLSYQVQIKRLFDSRSVRKNLKGIAEYLTKGGNENLIYKMGFGYDSEDKINRQLVKSGRANLEVDYDGFENEYSLSVQEMKVLGRSLDRLMGRTNSNMRNGYLFRYGQQQKWVR